MDKQIYEQTVELISKVFKPELVGRLRDNIIVFRTLTRSQQARVLDNMLAEMQRLVSGKDETIIPIRLYFSQSFKEFLLDEGMNRLYGVRPLKATVRKHVKKIEQDRTFHKDIENIARLIQSDELIKEVEAITGPLA